MSKILDFLRHVDFRRPIEDRPTPLLDYKYYQYGSTRAFLHQEHLSSSLIRKTVGDSGPGILQAVSSSVEAQILLGLDLLCIGSSPQTVHICTRSKFYLDGHQTMSQTMRGGIACVFIDDMNVYAKSVLHLSPVRSTLQDEEIFVFDGNDVVTTEPFAGRFDVCGSPYTVCYKSAS